ncbi:hypothetical protein [Companilactobacillus paralimentarius]|uniref:hypothetical protein n=1 Tax=Companilactobacillus paralimentarius TaxID=83526 RepID=UPI0012A7B356|nr:hypothetical protein [Companilactobacillus paralimentarius]QFR68479.1 hypothetical protein LP238_00450 [Companilactobacillus paralimentarius]
MIGGGRSSSDDDTSNKASGHTTTQTEKGSKSSSNKDTLDINYDNHKILDQNLMTFHLMIILGNQPTLKSQRYLSLN